MKSTKLHIFDSISKDRIVVKETEEFIDANKKESLLRRFFKKMHTKYNLSPYEFRSFIRRNTNINIVCRYRSLTSQILRKFRIRI